MAKDLRPHKTRPVLRNTVRILYKEVKIPVFISVPFTIIVIFLMIFMQLGLDYKSLFAALALVAAISFAFITEVNKDKSILKDNDAIVLICLVVIIGILALQISQDYLSPLIFPVSAFTVLTAILIGSRIAVVYLLSLTVLAAILSGSHFYVFFCLFCSALAVMPSANLVSRRTDFVIIGIRTAIAGILVLTMFYLLDTHDFLRYKQSVYYVLLNGALTVAVLLVLMPIFEKIFSRTTNIKLVELSDFNNPLLKKLMHEAPGTYHHSIMAAAIAERAAESIGESPLLARVCAYYHDIGKLKNPKYFVENQNAGQNPHEYLTPAMSALILAAHVKDGIALARQYNLDNAIIDSIEQHHGTSLMSFFYSKALEINSEVSKETFTYQGPSPRSKMAAITMLADSSEAACRSIEDITAVKIKDMVERILEHRFEERQFDKCPITLKEIQDIKEGIISALIGMYHARIVYPDSSEEAGKAENGAAAGGGKSVSAPEAEMQNGSFIEKESAFAEQEDNEKTKNS
jgi:putative nucleotidyltransferase with HDIG domain